jgi:hypothetical protein
MKKIKAPDITPLIKNLKLSKALFLQDSLLGMTISQNYESAFEESKSQKQIFSAFHCYESTYPSSLIRSPNTFFAGDITFMYFLDCTKIRLCGIKGRFTF